MNEKNMLNRHLRTARTVFAMIAATVLVDVSVAQIAKRNFEWWYSNSFVDVSAYRAPSPIYHHDLKANVKARAAWGPHQYWMATNDLGFRDRIRREVARDSESQRILFIGDSFTEGIGVEFEDSFVGLLEAPLRERDVEVLNAGVASYSPSIYFRKVQYLIDEVNLAFDRLIVFIDISDIRDEALLYYLDDQNIVQSRKDTSDHVAPQGQFLWKVKRLLRDNSVIARSADALKDRLESIAESGPADAGNAITEGALGRFAALWTIQDDLYLSYGEAGLQQASRHMDMLFNTVREHGIEMAIVVYPWPDQILNGDAESLQVTHWRQWAATRGIEFIDLFPVFMEVCRSEDDLQTYFIQGDVHWNEEGHRLVAQNVLRALMQ